MFDIRKRKFIKIDGYILSEHSFPYKPGQMDGWMFVGVTGETEKYQIFP